MDGHAAPRRLRRRAQPTWPAGAARLRPPGPRSPSAEERPIPGLREDPAVPLREKTKKKSPSDRSTRAISPPSRMRTDVRSPSRREADGPTWLSCRTGHRATCPPRSTALTSIAAPLRLPRRRVMQPAAPAPLPRAPSSGDAPLGRPQARPSRGPTPRARARAGSGTPTVKSAIVRTLRLHHARLGARLASSIVTSTAAVHQSARTRHAAPACRRASAGSTYSPGRRSYFA